MTFSNVYADAERAEAYATLEFPGTYFLAFRDLPRILQQHVAGRTALDFGCGAGRSTRFLQNLGFTTTGIDISTNMIERARRADPAGDYVCVDNGHFEVLGPRRFDLILCAFPFDNIPGAANRAGLLGGLGRLLAPNGRIVILGSTPEIYTHEWTSFTTKDFPENRNAKSGEPVQIVMKDVADARPVVDLIWFHEDYLALFEKSGLTLEAAYHPLGHDSDGQPWVTETTIAPWVIYVLGVR